MSKDDLLVRVAQGLGGLSDLDDGWASLAMVFSFARGDYPSSFGYAFAADGDWTAISGDLDALEDDVAALRAAMAAESGQAWLQGLFRLKRAERRIDCDFAYEVRWKVTPQNLDEMIETLRP